MYGNKSYKSEFQYEKKRGFLANNKNKGGKRRQWSPARPIRTQNRYYKLAEHPDRKQVTSIGARSMSGRNVSSLSKLRTGGNAEPLGRQGGRSLLAKSSYVKYYNSKNDRRVPGDSKYKVVNDRARAHKRTSGRSSDHPQKKEDKSLHLPKVGRTKVTFSYSKSIPESVQMSKGLNRRWVSVIFKPNSSSQRKERVNLNIRVDREGTRIVSRAKSGKSPSGPSGEEDMEVDGSPEEFEHHEVKGENQAVQAKTTRVPPRGNPRFAKRFGKLGTERGNKRKLGSDSSDFGAHLCLRSHLRNCEESRSSKRAKNQVTEELEKAIKVSIANFDQKILSFQNKLGMSNSKYLLSGGTEQTGVVLTEQSDSAGSRSSGVPPGMTEQSTNIVVESSQAEQPREGTSAPMTEQSEGGGGTTVATGSNLEPLGKQRRRAQQETRVNLEENMDYGDDMEGGQEAGVGGSEEPVILPYHPRSQLMRNVVLTPVASARNDPLLPGRADSNWEIRKMENQRKCDYCHTYTPDDAILLSHVMDQHMEFVDHRITAQLSLPPNIARVVNYSGPGLVEELSEEHLNELHEWEMTCYQAMKQEEENDRLALNQAMMERESKERVLDTALYNRVEAEFKAGDSEAWEKLTEEQKDAYHAQSKIVHAQRAQERRASDDAFNRLFINTGGEGNLTAELVAHTSGSDREIYNAASVVEDVQFLEANSDLMESGDDIEQVTVGERPSEGTDGANQASGQEVQPITSDDETMASTHSNRTAAATGEDGAENNIVPSTSSADQHDAPTTGAKRSRQRSSTNSSESSSPTKEPRAKKRGIAVSRGTCSGRRGRGRNVARRGRLMTTNTAGSTPNLRPRKARVYTISSESDTEVRRRMSSSGRGRARKSRKSKKPVRTPPKAGDETPRAGPSRIPEDVDYLLESSSDGTPPTIRSSTMLGEISAREGGEENLEGGNGAEVEQPQPAIDVQSTINAGPRRREELPPPAVIDQVRMEQDGGGSSSTPVPSGTSSSSSNSNSNSSTSSEVPSSGNSERNDELLKENERMRDEIEGLQSHISRLMEDAREQNDLLQQATNEVGVLRSEAKEHDTQMAKMTSDIKDIQAINYELGLEKEEETNRANTAKRKELREKEKNRGLKKDLEEMKELRVKNLEQEKKMEFLAKQSRQLATSMENANKRAEVAEKKAEEWKEKVENAERELLEREAVTCPVCDGEDCITVDEESLHELAGLWTTDQQMQVRTEMQMQQKRIAKLKKDLKEMIDERIRDLDKQEKKLKDYNDSDERSRQEINRLNDQVTDLEETRNIITAQMRSLKDQESRSEEERVRSEGLIRHYAGLVDDLKRQIMTLEGQLAVAKKGQTCKRKGCNGIYFEDNREKSCPYGGHAGSSGAGVKSRLGVRSEGGNTPSGKPTSILKRKLNILCKHFFSSQGCLSGEHCRFVHPDQDGNIPEDTEVQDDHPQKVRFSKNRTVRSVSASDQSADQPSSPRSRRSSSRSRRSSSTTPARNSRGTSRRRSESESSSPRNRYSRWESERSRQREFVEREEDDDDQRDREVGRKWKKTSDPSKIKRSKSARTRSEEEGDDEVFYDTQESHQRRGEAGSSSTVEGNDQGAGVVQPAPDSRTTSRRTSRTEIREEIHGSVRSETTERSQRRIIESTMRRRSPSQPSRRTVMEGVRPLARSQARGRRMEEDLGENLEQRTVRRVRSPSQSRSPRGRGRSSRGEQRESRYRSPSWARLYSPERRRQSPTRRTSRRQRSFSSERMRARSASRTLSPRRRRSMSRARGNSRERPLPRDRTPPHSPQDRRNRRNRY